MITRQEKQQSRPDPVLPMREITWGDTVQVVSEAPTEFRPGELGSICGVSEIRDETSGALVKMFTVEFGDGTDVNLRSDFVQLYED